MLWCMHTKENFNFDCERTAYMGRVDASSRVTSNRYVVIVQVILFLAI